MRFWLDVSVEVSLRVARKEFFVRAADSEMFLVALFLAFVLLRLDLLRRTLRVLELLKPLKIDLGLRADENIGVLGDDFPIASSMIFPDLLWVSLTHILIRSLCERLVEPRWLVNLSSLPFFFFLQFKDALRLSRILVGRPMKH